MPLSSFALILGVVAYVFGFPLIFGDKDLVAWKKKLSKDETSLRFAGVTFAVLAVLVLKKQWQFTMDADGLIVVAAWITLAKALLLAWWPDQIVAVKGGLEDRLLSTPGMQTLTGVVLVFGGALFTYLGLVLI
ncbi:MAG TPA: hypothetical protein PKV72_02205 [Candidatus Peribacteria bacterium]|nr:hypothetical protein [Candidatus Peribacteria bacterium]